MGSSTSSKFVTQYSASVDTPMIVRRKEHKEKEACMYMLSSTSRGFPKEDFDGGDRNLSQYQRDKLLIEISESLPTEKSPFISNSHPLLSITVLRPIVQEYAPECAFINSYGFSRSISLGHLYSCLMDENVCGGYVKQILEIIILRGYIRDWEGVLREIDSSLLFVGGLFDVLLSSLNYVAGISFKEIFRFMDIQGERREYKNEKWIEDALRDIVVPYRFSSNHSEIESLPEALIRICVPSVITDYINMMMKTSFPSLYPENHHGAREDLSLQCICFAVRYDRPKHVVAIFRENSYDNLSITTMDMILQTRDLEERGRFLREAIRSGLAMHSIIALVDGRVSEWNHVESSRRIQEYVEAHCILLGGMDEKDVKGAVVTLKGGIWYHQFPRTKRVTVFRILYILQSRFPTKCRHHLEDLYCKGHINVHLICTGHDSKCGIIKNCPNNATRLVIIPKKPSATDSRLGRGEKGSR